MTVLRGTLQTIGEGNTIESQSSWFTANMGIIREHKVKARMQGFVRREVVEIDDTQIRNVMLPPIYDQLLREAIGEQVAISFSGSVQKPFKEHVVHAIRTRRAGLVRQPLWRMIAGTFVQIFRMWIAALFGGIIVGLAACIVFGIIGKIIGVTNLVFVGVAVGAAFFLWLFLAPFYYSLRAFRLRAALDGLDGQLEGVVTPTG